MRPRKHCTEIVPRFSRCVQSQEQVGGGSQDTALGSAVPGICRHRTGLSVLCSQPSKPVLLQCEGLQGPSADNNPTVSAALPHRALSCSSVNSSSQQLTHLNAPSYLDCYQHLITASLSTNCSLRNSHFPLCSENSLLVPVGIKIPDNTVKCSLSSIGRIEPLPGFDWFRTKSAWLN